MLMVSGIPMRKMHTVRVPPKYATAVLVVLVLFAAAAVLQPFITIWVVIIAYLCHVPFAIHNKRWLAKHPEVWDDQPKQRRAVRRANRRAQPNRRSMTRLGLRKPSGRLR
jgi:CDP-diacylglycerol--serine O-phosphatidyltransferase